MGDMTTEPSMEEILSSIKRIIAEENDDRVGGSTRVDRRVRPSAQARSPVPESEPRGEPPREEEILELTDSVDPVEDRPRFAALTGEPDVSDDMDAGEEPGSDYVRAIETAMSPSAAAAAAARVAAPSFGRRRLPASALPDDNIVSPASESAARSSLAALSSLVVGGTAEPGDNTLEGLVRDMLRPMLKEWLDAKLPDLVEGMVAREIARITGHSL